MDRKTRFEDWLAQNIALVCFVVFGGGAVIAILAAVAFSNAATTSHPEGDEFGGVGVRNVRVTEPAKDGSYDVIVQGVREVNTERALRRAGYDQTAVGLWPSGKVNCGKAWEKITANDPFGVDIGYTKHNFQACWNGNKVLSYAASGECDIAWPGGTKSPDIWQHWYAPWKGAVQGSAHSYLKCVFGGGNSQHVHKSEIVYLGTGKALWPSGPPTCPGICRP